MVDIDEDPDVDGMERFAGKGSVLKRAWARTVEDMQATAEERREHGWDVTAIPAGDTGAVSRDDGSDDRFGIVHTIADNHAEEFAEAFDRGEFPRYEAYLNEVEGFVYLLTEFLDPESETVVMIAGQYERRHAAGALRSAEDEGACYTHVKTIDGTHLGSFRHEEYAPLFPDTVVVED